MNYEALILSLSDYLADNPGQLRKIQNLLKGDPKIHQAAQKIRLRRGEDLTPKIQVMEMT